MNNASIKLVAVIDGEPNQFILMLKQITFSFRASSASDRDEWLDAFKRVLAKQRNQGTCRLGTFLTPLSTTGGEEEENLKRSTKAE